MKVKPRILLVDDNAMVRQVLQMVLEEFGYAVYSAANGPDALNLFQAHPIDLVLVEHYLPVLDGYTLYAELHAARPVPVIFISGVQAADVWQHALKTGVVAFLHKPFSFSDLAQSINRVLHSPS
jgi:CheY-like chemotaxis protein